MKKLFIMAVLVFYFGIRMTSTDPKVFISIVVGPFQTLIACQTAYDEAMEVYNSVFDGEFKSTKCSETKSI